MPEALTNKRTSMSDSAKRLAAIRHGMTTRDTWREDDWIDFYNHDVTFLLKHVEDLQATLNSARKKVDKIVCTEGEDKGVVLLSNDGPCDWSEEHKCQVYRHEYFSPLGDALIDLYETVLAATGGQHVISS